MTLILSGTNGLSDVDGSAATPAIRGTDANTGIFFPAADTIAFAEGGVEAARIDSSGNLGLGVTPSAWGSGYTGLDIKYLGISNTGAGTVDCSFTQNGYYNGTNWIAKYTSPSKRYSISDSGHIWYNGASATAGSAITFTQAMTLDASGNLLVGATSNANSYKIYAKNNNTNTTALTLENNNGGYQVYTSSGELAFFQLNVGERARITSGGYFKASPSGSYNDISGPYHELRGAGANTYELIVSNTNASPASEYIQDIRFTAATPNNTNARFLACTDATNEKAAILSTGGFLSRNNSYGTYSDIKLKENIVDSTPKLDDVLQLRVRNFNFKSDAASKQIGFIAQEFEQVFPALVDESEDRDANGAFTGEITKSIKTSVLIPILVKAIQEQQALITTLTARLDAANL
jgi:hypothetical protein